MSDSLFKKVDWFSEFEPDLNIYYSKTITSMLSDHRRLIKAHLAQTLNQEYGLDCEKINRMFGLSSSAELDKFRISISHSPIGSIYSVAKSHIHFGIDIENIQRITPQIIERISKPQEYDSAPTVEFLFSAKESTWKALRGYKQPKTISCVTIEDWKKVTSDIYRFKARIENRRLEGVGYILKKK